MKKPLKKLKVEKAEASSIKPNAYNPNRQKKGDFELLVRSIVEDGFTQPIVVQKKTREIVDGEHRWTAMIGLSFMQKHWPLEERGSLWPPALIEEVRGKRQEILAGPVSLEAKGFAGTYEGVDPKIDIVFVNFTDEQMRIATLRHNRARGAENTEKLGAVLADLESLGVGDWAKTSLGLDSATFDRLIDSTVKRAAEALAGADFSQAWEPDVVGDDVELKEEGVEFSTGGGGDQPPVTLATSKAGVAALKARSEALAAAPTAAERREVARSMPVYKVTAVFSGEDGAVVRQVLGERPAEKLLDLCKARDAKEAA